MGWPWAELMGLGSCSRSCRKEPRGKFQPVQTAHDRSLELPRTSPKARRSVLGAWHWSSAAARVANGTGFKLHW